MYFQKLNFDFKSKAIFKNEKSNQPKKKKKKKKKQKNKTKNL